MIAKVSNPIQFSIVSHILYANTAFGNHEYNTAWSVIIREPAENLHDPLIYFLFKVSLTLIGPFIELDLYTFSWFLLPFGKEYINEIWLGQSSDNSVNHGTT